MWSGVMSTAGRSFTGAAGEHAARAARLPLTPERLAMVGATLEGIYALIDLLDTVALGETPPATAFDPRWQV